MYTPVDFGTYALQVIVQPANASKSITSEWK